MTFVYFQNRGRMNILTLPKYLCLNFFRKFKHINAKRNSGGLTIYIKESRSNMGTVDNIFVLQRIISHMLNEGKRLYCAFIDFTKAFDYVVRDNLWMKLIKLGMRGNILNIIKSMYCAVKSRVKLGNKLSDAIEASLGVRQGESVSPFLFFMFFNDIEDVFMNKGLSVQFTSLSIVL